MLVSIVILSYNRPKQLERILENFIGVASSEFNIIIKDDVSPSVAEIRSICEEYKARLNIEVSLHENKTNLGYDSNLLDSFNITDSDYVYLLSDDDYIDGLKFNELVDFIKSTRVPVYFSPYNENGDICREIDSNFSFDENEIDISGLIYNSILFSGLIFDRKKVLALQLDIDFLKSCIYTQVYLVMSLIYRHKQYACANNDVLFLGGDGDNFFGKNQSAVNSELLHDRGLITANLRYQAFLRLVVKKTSEENSLKINSDFEKEINKRLVSYALKARANGRKSYDTFIEELEHNITNSSVIKLIYVVGYIPSVFCKVVYRLGVKFLKKSG